VENTSVTVQWEADLDVEGSALGYDCLRLCLTGEVQKRYIQVWVLSVCDATTQIHEIWNILGHGWDYILTAPTALLAQEARKEQGD
jgi:hypothetical protein